MFELYTDCVSSGDLDTLREMALRWPFFLELRQVLSQSYFNTLLIYLRCYPIHRREPLVLMSNCLYFFSDKGILYSKEVTGKSQKSIRGRDKPCQTPGNRIYNRQQQNKESSLWVIDEFDCYENQTVNKSIHNIYQPSSNRPSAVLWISFESIPSQFTYQIREVNQSKAKFLSECDLMRSIQFASILEKIQKFKFLQLKFGETLNSNGPRPNSILFLRSGTIEIFPNKSKSNSFLIEKGAIYRLENSGEAWARCISQKVECYFINSEYLSYFFPRLRNIESKIVQPSNLMIQHYNTSALTSPVSETPQGSQQNFHIHSLIDITKGANSSRRHLHRSTDNLKRCDTNSRLWMVKRHFSNYYNEVFDEFSERKIKYMGLNIQNECDLKLYNIKILQRKTPFMDEINKKLKKQRIEKLMHSKERLKKNGQIHNPILVGNPSIGTNNIQF